MHVSLNAKELLLPAPFSFTARTSDILLKKHLFGFDNHVYRTENMRFKASLNFWYMVFWACAQKAAATRHVSTKLSSLSMSYCKTVKYTQVYKNTFGYVCEGKQLGKKLHVYAC